MLDRCEHVLFSCHVFFRPAGTVQQVRLLDINIFKLLYASFSCCIHLKHSAPVQHSNTTRIQHSVCKGASLSCRKGGRRKSAAGVPAHVTSSYYLHSKM